MKILSVDLREALAGDPVDNILVEPRDRLLVHRNPTESIRRQFTSRAKWPSQGDIHSQRTCASTILVRVAGGLKRSAYTDSADLARFDMNGPGKGPGDRLEVNLAAVMSGDATNGVLLRDGDILTIRQLPRWNEHWSIYHGAGRGSAPGYVRHRARRAAEFRFGREAGVRSRSGIPTAPSWFETKSASSR